MMRAMSRKKPCPLFSKIGDGAPQRFYPVSEVRDEKDKSRCGLNESRVGSGVIDDCRACFWQVRRVFNEPGYADCCVNEIVEAIPHTGIAPFCSQGILTWAIPVRKKAGARVKREIMTSEKWTRAMSLFLKYERTLKKAPGRKNRT